MRNRHSAAALALALAFTSGCLEDKAPATATMATATATAEAAKAAAETALLATRVAAMKKGSLTDVRDKRIYKTVKIGTKTWMAENLNYRAKGSKCFGEGKVIDECEMDCDGKSYIILPPAEVQSRCAQYGRLYNWETAMSACPAGWHLPSNAEWNDLLKFVDEVKKGSGKDRPCGTGTCYESNSAAQYLRGATDDFGFSALLGGYGTSNNIFGGHYYPTGVWWSASKASGTRVYVRKIADGHEYSPNVYWSENDKGNLHSIRCIKN